MNVKEYIESGILEMYLLGDVSESERLEVEKMKALHHEISDELMQIEIGLEKFGQMNKKEPHAAVKPMILATLDFVKRMENGETPSHPPLLTSTSKKEDYKEWLNRTDFGEPKEIEEIHGKIISMNAETGATLVVWIKHMAPEEVHHAEYEKFLILEGTCDIVVSGKIHSLIPGDFFQIPLYEDHEVIVTSENPCKVILQRTAA
jgi:mannose-6-phosphate isomerase-like protein (cupin superfamily)